MRACCQTRHKTYLHMLRVVEHRSMLTQAIPGAATACHVTTASAAISCRWAVLGALASRSSGGGEVGAEQPQIAREQLGLGWERGLEQQGHCAKRARFQFKVFHAFYPEPVLANHRF